MGKVREGVAGEREYADGGGNVRETRVNVGAKGAGEIIIVCVMLMILRCVLKYF